MKEPKDKKASVVRDCVTIVKVYDQKYERINDGKYTRLIEERYQFCLGKALSLVVPNRENPKGYAIFNHQKGTADWFEGSSSELMNFLGARGLLKQ